MKEKKRRLIDILCEKYPENNRKDLNSMIFCGEVFINNEKLRDPSFLISDKDIIEIIRKKYVSRGGLKLEKVLDIWKINIKGKFILDAGCSTGGFTDCLLQNGAAGIYAVDVGFNQLDYKLRKDSRVTVFEKTNIMDIGELNPVPDFAVADISFRSIRTAASHIIELTREKKLAALIKPQFEISKKSGDFDGVIRDITTLENVLSILCEDLFREGAYISSILESPIRGKKGGNREFFFLCKKEKTCDLASIICELKRILNEAD